MGSLHCVLPVESCLLKMTKKTVIVIVLVAAVTAIAQEVAPIEETPELLEGAESQNYGYGYGSKVDGPHGTSTVYVHGFGTDDGYGQDGYGGHSAYGYGHIDPYLNTKHGYGQGYNQVHGYTGYGHYGVDGQGLGVGHHVGHAVAHRGHGVVSHGLGHGVVSHGLGHKVEHGHAPVYGAGYGAPQPFVGNGFRYGHGYGYGYGH